MKRFLYLLFLVIVIFMLFESFLFNLNNSYCYDEKITLEFETVDDSEMFDLYILLPRDI